MPRKDKESRAQYMREWQAKNRERTRELAKATYHRYKTKYALKKRAQRKKSPEKEREINKRNYYNHLEDRRAAMREYAKRNHLKFLDYSSKRRALLRMAKTETVERAIVFVRDNGICYLCKEPADINNWDLEHIIPLKLGGEHAYHNVAVSHPQCNGAKGTNLVEQRPQMLLVANAV